jgi:uncharacterized protein YbaR (Trm112 family)
VEFRIWDWDERHYEIQPMGAFMIDKGLLNVLVCPKDHTPLVVADGRLTAKLNRAIAAGHVVNGMGQRVSQQIDGGLVRSDKALLYPILDGIPVMLADEAIPLDQLN